MSQIGSTLNNRYRLDKKIGEGGFAQVFLATDLELGRQVAVKVLEQHWARLPTSLLNSCRAWLAPLAISICSALSYIRCSQAIYHMRGIPPGYCLDMSMPHLPHSRINLQCAQFIQPLCRRSTRCSRRYS